MGGVGTNMPDEEESKGSESGTDSKISSGTSESTTLYKGYHMFNTQTGGETYEKLMHELCPQASQVFRDNTIKLTPEIIVRQSTT